MGRNGVDRSDSQEGVVASLHAASKKQALAELAGRAEALTDVPQRKSTMRSWSGSALARRASATGSRSRTPSCRPLGTSSACSRGCRRRSISIRSMSSPSISIFLLLAPIGAGADHLKALARVSRLLRNHTICEKLRGSHDASAMYVLLTEPMSARGLSPKDKSPGRRPRDRFNSSRSRILQCTLTGTISCWRAVTKAASRSSSTATRVPSAACKA